jgi:hypothetical protein
MSLTNFEVEHIAKLLKIKHFHGVYLQDDLKAIKDKNKDGSYIINYGTLKNGGTHYICVLVYGDAVFHFDSFGATYSDDVSDFIANKKYKAFNQHIIQDLDSSLCGWYCLFLIYYVQNKKDKKMTFFQKCNDYVNLFNDDSRKNSPILRQLFHSALPKWQTPKHLFDILRKP